MKKILLLVVVCCTLLVARAQRVYFIYVQTDNKSAFYFKTGDKVYSSTAGGYLIVPRLVDSTYHVVIGKPGGGEARFTIPINGKDKGFLLRESGQQLSLFDLQSMNVIQPTSTGSEPVSVTQKTDRFTTLLAQAADDPSLLQVAYVAEKPKKAVKAAEAVAAAPTVTETEKPIADKVEEKQAVAQTETAPPAKDTQTIVAQTNTSEKIDSAATVATEKATAQQEAEVVAKSETKPAEVKAAEPEPAVVNEPASEANVYKRSVVTRRAESSTSEGFGLMFTDSSDGVVDTIRLVIPNPRTTFLAEAEEPVQEDRRFLELPKESSKAEVAVKEKEEKEGTKKRNSLFAKRERNKDEEPVVKEPAKEKETAAKKEEGCRNQASDGDVARLRRSMVGKSSEDDMIGEGQKYFKTRCFTTQQIKGLSSLLLTSAGRYQFFEAAYNHVSDKEKFYTLQNELWDRADINRFKALLAK